MPALPRGILPALGLPASLSGVPDQTSTAVPPPSTLREDYVKLGSAANPLLFSRRLGVIRFGERTESHSRSGASRAEPRGFCSDYGVAPA